MNKQHTLLSFVVVVNYKATMTGGLHTFWGFTHHLVNLERATKHLLELWDDTRLQDAGAGFVYLPSSCPFRDVSGSEEHSQGSATTQSIQRSPSATDMTAVLAECFHSLNPNHGCSTVRSERVLQSWDRKMRPNHLWTLITQMHCSTKQKSALRCSSYGNAMPMQNFLYR